MQMNTSHFLIISIPILLGMLRIPYRRRQKTSAAKGTPWHWHCGIFGFGICLFLSSKSFANVPIIVNHPSKILPFSISPPSSSSKAHQQMSSSSAYPFQTLSNILSTYQFPEGNSWGWTAMGNGTKPIKSAAANSADVLFLHSKFMTLRK
jgi:hypothetical protein